ncbi:hypothetical protein GCM10011409_43580 [Lentibacillus populi]|uniref:N-acetyltransferase domain-containing protein n=1 Tax=Lentibacillus populi TaxID=1827502 RepID=A0A9W5U1I4_9BACI|nr:MULTISPECIES: GNAT family N-acetyltransferase [Bacillaceae]GGB61629.1 hypothetical protein GCM10011409_43580 [Lentibacillus populi]
MTEQIEIRELTTLDELTEMQHVEKAVWHMPPIPIHQTYTALNNGGIILGAFKQETMIGFLYSFAGFAGDIPYLCSHMLGILPVYRQDGLGLLMKCKQAELAKQKGYAMITWTFDPLESLNAYLNLHKIGAVGAHYHVNHYGKMDDGLNQGLPTDRIQIEWWLNKEIPVMKTTFDEDSVLLDRNDDGFPVVNDIVINGQYGWFVAIPENFQAIKHQDIAVAKAWRYETRHVFKKLFSKGYQAVDLVRDPAKQVSYYFFN